MSNTELANIAEVLKNSGRTVLYPHVNIDGDTLGSCMALARALKKLGKHVYVLIDEDIPDNLRFLDNGTCTSDRSLAAGSDVSVAVDWAQMNRIGSREEVFKTAETTICIDHHGTSKPICDYNYIDPKCAATGQLIFELIKHLGAEPDPEMGNAIYAAIATDTGNFQYSNTQKVSHLIAAELYDWGITPDKVCIEIYQSNRMERIMIETQAMETLACLCGGQLAIAYVTQDMLAKTGAEMSETDNIVTRLRSIKGVETAVLLKEEEKNVVKGSMRSKNWFDVSAAAEELGGGGHERAAGFTLYTNLEEAFQRVSVVMTERMEQYDKRDNKCQ